MGRMSKVGDCVATNIFWSVTCFIPLAAVALLAFVIGGGRGWFDVARAMLCPALTAASIAALVTSVETRHWPSRRTRNKVTLLAAAGAALGVMLLVGGVIATLPWRH